MFQEWSCNLQTAWVRGDVAPAAVNTPNQVDYILKPENAMFLTSASTIDYGHGINSEPCNSCQDGVSIHDLTSSQNTIQHTIAASL